MFSVYILFSRSKNRFYKGHSKNLKDRLERHNSGYEKSTKSGIPWILLWKTDKNSKSEAYRLEKKLKNLNKKKTLEFMLNHKDGISGQDEMQLLVHLS